MISELSGYSVKHLPRGGVVVSWDDLWFQLGAYPETIKDTMGSNRGVPDLYLLPDQLFDVRNGVTAAELEFPLYYNFYMKERRLRFVCRQDQLRPMLRVLKEAIFGPSPLVYDGEFPQGALTPGYPDLAAEMRYYKHDLSLRDMIEPIVFDEEGQAEVDGVRLTRLGRNRFEVEREGESHQVEFRPPDPDVLHTQNAPRYSPPDFGITVIGAGHGFDASTTTSGFIIWLGGRGVLVDPPVNSTLWLAENGVDGRLIEDVVLTHCHADHDSGTLQKILQEGRINLHTTPTVKRSFLRKYASLTGLSVLELEQLFNFHPLVVGHSINVGGGQFTFRYTLHPIPTLGFELTFQGKTFAYSCDTLYDPEVFRELHREGRMSAERMEQLIGFNWQADLILHEAGMPPIHTPMEVLAAQPESVKRNLYLAHVSEDAIPADCGLRRAPTGLDNTLVLEVEPPAMSPAQKMLDVMVHTDLFRDLEVAKALEFLCITRSTSHRPGEVIIRRGERGDRFFMIESGEAEVVKDGRVVKILSRYDYFGEMALALDQPRIADIVARTPLELLSIDRVDFLHFIAQTDLPAMLRQVAQNKMTDFWPLMSENRLLARMSSYQKTQLMAIVKECRFPAETVLYRLGGLPTKMFLLADGEVRLWDGEGNRVTVGRGALVGRIPEEDGSCLHPTEAVCKSEVRAYAATHADLKKFFRVNPGTFVRALQAMRDRSPAYLI